MKVSIFLNNYNYTYHLKRSINSLIKQIYKNIEIIVYDYKSNDYLKKIINSFKGVKKIYSTFKSNKSYLGQINVIDKLFCAYKSVKLDKGISNVKFVYKLSNLNF